MILDLPTRSIRVFSDVAATTTEPTGVAGWDDLRQDNDQAAPGANTIDLSGATPITLVPAPAAVPYLSRKILDMTVFNEDTVAHTITIQYRDTAGALDETIFKASLAAGSRIYYSPDGGFIVLTGYVMS